MKSFLQQRSKALTHFLNGLIPILEENPIFEKEVYEAGIKTNILRTRESRKDVKNGLETLKNEKWLSESELQAGLVHL